MMAFLFIAVCATAQQMPQLPVDKDVRIGKLDNGLTYYIRYNNWPENRAEFYIAQRVGSIQENDDQRGLAHFLEHMCFNGTKNFPGNGVIRYCESIGVQFGGDLNAYMVFNDEGIVTSYDAEGNEVLAAEGADREGANVSARKLADNGTFKYDVTFEKVIL